MKIVFAKNLGFCTGVKRAIAIAKDALEKNPKPVYFLGETVHNDKLVEKIKEEGGKLISSPGEALSGTLVIRAHGEKPFKISPKIIVRDATCPLVKKVQQSAKLLQKKGYRVIIIGEKEHPEIKGIRGCVKNKAVVVGNRAEAEKLKKIKKAGVVSQTTQNIDNVKQILDVLKKKSEELKWINTLCPQVLFRQEELSRLLNSVDGVLVIGSASSANTNRLTAIAKAARKPTWRVNSAKELERKQFKNTAALGVVSGTSAPDWEVEKIKAYLKKIRTSSPAGSENLDSRLSARIKT